MRMLALLLLVLSAHGAPLSGTRTIGPTGDYASVTAAIADVQAQTLGGALVLELQPAYVSTVESFPLTIPALNGASAVNTVTLRPAAGATALSISSAAAQTLDLNGAQFLTIDGRPGGTAAAQLTIANTSPSGAALRFINEASTNTVRYATLRGVNIFDSGGVLVFSTTTGANGNDNNTVDHCDIRDGASTPLHGIYSLGTSATTVQFNSGNTVSNCNVFNFYAVTALDSAGVRLDGGNTGWTLTGNSFYQTSDRAAVAANVRPIYINSTSGSNFTVTGNFIGGGAPGAGGTAWTTIGTAAAYLFQGIQLSVGTATPSSVQGNTVRNIAWTSSASASAVPGVWCGIYMSAGPANIGTVTGNAIGSGTGTGSVSVTTSGTGGTAFGIASASKDPVTIANNTIGSITANGSTTAVSASLIGIQVAAGKNTISNNTVGSTVSANSLNAATPSTSGSIQQVSGIKAISTSASAIITGNTVANLNNNYPGVGSGIGLISGIVTTVGANTITGNTVRNLATTSQNADHATSQSVHGILQTSKTAGQTVSQNTVHSLANTSAGSTGVSVTGIYFSGSTSGTNVVARNLVHSLAVSSTSTSSGVNGMWFEAGTFTAQNNMVRVGLDAGGGSTAGVSVVRGIFDNGLSGARNFWHNSVHVGGTETSGTNPTYAFQSSGSSNARNFWNNIFVNARGNSGATSGHYAVRCSLPTGLTAGGNLFLASGTGGVLGYYVNADKATLAAWQAATGQDATSAVADPLFIAPAGTAATVDLHLQPINPAEGGALPIAAVTDDFDGEPRSSLTPADIGADAGNFTSTGDIFAPGISYPMLTSGSTASRVLTGWATIADNSGTVSGGASAPRLYYKKSTDADAFGGNTSADTGWKYVTASNGTSPFSFTMDYALLYGGGVTVGDTIQYFLVAQDAANNLGSSPAAATASANPPVQNINGKPGAGVNSYAIVPALSGTKTVGSGGDYPSLSGAGGLFATLNGAVPVGDLTVSIISDVTENGSVSLNAFNSNEYPQASTVTIQPDSATMRTISGTSAAGLIRLNGADRVSMDGRFGGTGRYLTFRNTSTASSASTILFINDASSNTVRSSIVEGATASGALGVIGFSTGTVTGNDDNLITGCQVRDLSTAAGVPIILIGSTGNFSAVANSGNTIADNELFNFNIDGIYISPTGNESWTISGNNIHEVNAANGSTPYGIDFEGGGTNVIMGNFIHDLTTDVSSSYGIYFSGTGTTTIARNRITAFNVNAATQVVIGIYTTGSAGSTLNVLNNQITLSPATSVSTMLYGLYDFGTGVVNAFGNSIVLGGTESGTASSWAIRRLVAGTHTARDNVFFNFRTGGSGSHFAAGSEVTGGSYIASNNVYAGTGATAANFMDFSGTSGTAVPVGFATWQSSTGDTASQAGQAGTGSFTAAMFANAAAGDLHLVPGGNALVNTTGTPIAGVSDDYDGDVRSPATPSIGSDEARVPDIAIEQPAGNGLTDGVSTRDFGTATVNSGTVVAIFKITNAGTADLTGLAVTLDGTNAGDFGTTQPGSSTLAPGASTFFNVSFTPTATGARSAAIHIANNVAGAKNPFDIALAGTGQTAFAAWAIANGVPTDPTANGGANVQAFAFGMTPGAGGALVFNGNFSAGGTIGRNGLPITMVESIANGTDYRALYVRRKDAAALGLAYRVDFSATLASWSTSAAVPTALADDGTYQIVSVPYPAFIIGGQTSFFHVRVTLTP